MGDSGLRGLGRAVVRRRDEVATGTVLVVGQLTVWTTEPVHGSAAYNAAVAAAAALTLAWRRRAPLGSVVAFVLAYCLPQAVAAHDLHFYTGPALLVVLTTSAAWYLRGPRGVVALVVALTGLAVLEYPLPEMRTWDRLADALWLVFPWGLMRVLRARDDRVRRLAGELAVLEATEEVRRREAVAAERARIARDLHDVVAHTTSVMVIQVGAARMRHEAGETDIGEQLLMAEATGRQAVGELRRLLDVLRSWPEDDAAVDTGVAPEPPQPSLDELGRLVDTYRAAGLDVELSVEPPAEMPLGVQVSAYRIVQEALTNSLRHGGGRPVTVHVEARADEVAIEVADRGPGARVPAAVDDGYGLVGMAERARLLGGSLDAGPNALGGWTVAAHLPGGAT